MMDRDTRRQRIEDAAFAVLAEQGWRSASMLAIAKRARSSNETLYAWYGGKAGLFRALVEANARSVIAALDTATAAGATPVEALSNLSQALLATVLGDRAVLLNRAAAADAMETGTLGPVLASLGRERVVPVVQQALSAVQTAGFLSPQADAADMAETYLALLIGDLQIRRVAGSMPWPGDEAIAERARWAYTRLSRLYPAE